MRGATLRVSGNIPEQRGALRRPDPIFALYNGRFSESLKIPKSDVPIPATREITEGCGPVRTAFFFE
jgi:hypothetical protein